MVRTDISQESPIINIISQEIANIRIVGKQFSYVLLSKIKYVKTNCLPGNASRGGETNLREQSWTIGNTIDDFEQDEIFVHPPYL